MWGFLQRCWWRFRYSGLWRRVNSCTFTDVSGDLAASILQSNFIRLSSFGGALHRITGWRCMSFQDSVVVPSLGANYPLNNSLDIGHFALRDGTTALSRNVRHRLPSDATYYLRWTENSMAPPRKPKISHDVMSVTYQTTLPYILLITT